MPFTPFHLGPALFLGLLLFSHLDLAAIMLTSVIVDVEPFFVMIFGLSSRLHGFSHTYLGATLLAIPSALGIYVLSGWLGKILVGFGLKYKSSMAKIVYTSLLGAYSHVLLDSFLYGEVQPFYPLLGNPFLGLASSGVVYGLCVISFFLGLGLFTYRSRFLRNRNF